jgi:NADPH:quinone reductase-like Zn-dependent oxidoreductase
VIATAGADDKLARCSQLGADVTVNYRTQSFADVTRAATDGRGADVVLDFVGAPYWEANMAALAIGGRLMLIGFLGGARGQLDLGTIMSKSLTIAGTTLRRTPLPQKNALTHDFAAFALPRFANGELYPVIDTVYPLDQAAEAHRAMEANRNIGKLVLRVE